MEQPLPRKYRSDAVRAKYPYRVRLAEDLATDPLWKSRLDPNFAPGPLLVRVVT